MSKWSMYGAFLRHLRKSDGVFNTMIGASVGMVCDMVPLLGLIGQLARSGGLFAQGSLVSSLTAGENQQPWENSEYDFCAACAAPAAAYAMVDPAVNKPWR